MKGFLTSFRGRLTLMSMALLAIGLTAYSLIVGFINLSRLSSHINQDLQQRGRMLAHAGPPRRAPNGEFMIPRGGAEPPPMMRRGPDEPQRGGPQPEGQPGMATRRRGPGDDLFLGNREPGENPDLRRARFTGSII